MGYLVGTAIFVGFEVVALLLVMAFVRGTQKRLVHTLCGTAVVCMWLLWTIGYLAQLNPMVSPIIPSE